METILTVNAGSSSLKFQVFATDGSKELRRLIKGQMDGIGTRPRLCAQGADRNVLIDRSYSPNDVTDFPAAIQGSLPRDRARAPGQELEARDMQTISLERSVEMIPDGASLMIGGFMAVGTPERVVDELVRQEKRDLTVIANDTATPDRGIGKLVAAKRVRKAIVSHIGLNPETQRQMMAGEMQVDLVPQGTLIERIRAGGYGLGGVLTQTGLGTPVADGKERVQIEGKSYLVEPALRADFALVHAFVADYLGNLSYALTARNFNPVIAMAGATVIACADNIVPVGVLPPDHVMTPAPVVDYLVANA